MKQSPYFTSGDVILQVPQVIQWLKDLGISNADCSRYSRYVNHISKFYNPDRSGVTAENFEKVTKGLSECLDVTIIKNIFPNERSKGFISRISKAINGLDFLEKSNACEARNFLFELSIAANLKNAGYTIDFDDDTDVIGLKNGYRLYGECKRISSKNKFEHNFKKAGKQLNNRISSNGNGKYGIIFLDISALICENIPKLPFNNTSEANFYFNAVMQNFEVENKDRINELNDRFVDSSLGVCLIGKTHVWTEPVELFSISNILLGVIN